MTEDQLKERFERLRTETLHTVSAPPMAVVRQRAARQTGRRRIAAVAAFAVVCAGVATAGLLTSREATTTPPPRPATTGTPSVAPSPSPTTGSGSGEGSEDFGPTAVSFITAAHGWALSPGGCHGCGDLDVTTDAGQRWSPVARSLQMPGDTPGLIAGRVGLYFTDDENGYLFATMHCQTRCVLTTHDGGHSWRPTPLPAIGQLVSSDDTADGRSNSTLYALTSRYEARKPALYRKAPGSMRWSRVDLPTASGGLFLGAQGDTVAVLVTTQFRHQPRSGRLWVSIDRGDHWSPRPVPCTSVEGSAALMSIALGHPSAMLLDCFNGKQSSQAQWTQHHLYGSSDGGRTWVRLADPAQTGDPTLLADNGNGHAFLAVMSGGRNLLATTLDAGRHWHKSITNAEGFFGWSGLRFLSPSTAFVLGPTHYAPEQLYRTVDGGRTWDRLPLPRPH
ncbi:MAG TPA: sialidase family protein [Nocardioidaceae bacterium]|nr:sialidase family protein [Nocardioidaceae bacterium]